MIMEQKKGHGGFREGAGRKTLVKNEKVKNITITLTASQRDKLYKIASEQNIGISELIRREFKL